MKFFYFRIAISILASIVSNGTNAQLCQGSLGDPVVNITFGTGPNYGSPLGPSITNYTYEPNGCPNDGLYVISNSLTSCFSGSWHPLSEDHTAGDANGYMMVVNASYNQGEFYVQKIDGLCSGTTYQLAAWIINVQRSNTCGANPIKPKVRFRVETISGTNLLDYSTGDIASQASPTWNQYGTFFTMPQGETSLMIRIINDAPGGCGNDLALDDITFRPCGALVTAGINGTNSSVDYCAGNATPTTFSVGSVAGNNVYYQWQTGSNNGTTWADIPGATSVSYTAPPVNNPGTYLYRQTVSQGANVASTCRVVSNVLSINVHPNPTLSIKPVLPVCEGEVLSLSASGGSVYFWRGPTSYTSNDQNAFVNNAGTNDSGKYYVVATSDKGCTTTDSVTATVLKKPIISVSSSATALCEGQSSTLNATGTDVVTWSWSPSKALSAANTSNPIAGPDTTTTYTVTGKNGTCTATDSLQIVVYKKPVANAGPDKDIPEGQGILLNGQVTGTNVSIDWSPALSLDRPTIATPLASPSQNTTYTLMVTSNMGCGSSSDQVVVKVYKDIVIPNVFSPNKDGINDTWEIPFLSLYNNASLQVFNRYGQLVHTTKAGAKSWDGNLNGQPVASGTYYYILDLKYGDKKYTGSVMIIR